MNKKITRRIIILTTVFLMLISFTSLGYKIGVDNRVYASEMIIKNEASKIASIAAYLALHYDRAEETAENLAAYIDSAKQTFQQGYYALSATNKVIQAMVFTDYELKDINNIYGTSFTETTLNDMGLTNLKNKINNGYPLTSVDFHLLGIDRLAAMQIKNNLANNALSQGTVIEQDGILYQNIIVAGENILIKAFDPNLIMLNTLPFKVKASAHIKPATLNPNTYFGYETTYYINHNEQYYKISYGHPYSAIKKDNMTEFYGGMFYLYSLSGNDWIQEAQTVCTQKNTNIMNKLYDLTGVSQILDNPLYGTKFSESFPISWTGDNISMGNCNTDFSVLGIGAGVLVNQGANDTSIDTAEDIINDLVNQGDDAVDIPISVTTYPNINTGEEEVILTPEGTTGVDTGSEATDTPDTSGDTNVNEDGTGMLNIPILGTILRWLQKIWQMIKDLYDLILNHFMNPSAADEGVDWGNFKNFFDILWIFYYLIILAIIILLKFFSVIMSILTIPANTALFDAYPTMLSGLNYIKNIKVGGFTVTLQTIFEYMFTVFFFLYIVTTLQKLYHSFMGIERVQRRENEREARFEKYDNERHYEPNNFTKGIMHANEQKPNNGLSFKDEDYENIKFTGWGD